MENSVNSADHTAKKMLAYRNSELLSDAEKKADTYILTYRSSLRLYVSHTSRVARACKTCLVFIMKRTTTTKEGTKTCLVLLRPSLFSFCPNAG